eukprot:CAMPEP_0117536926 /NCGR_PEP_ID=MMETSP0784-20121206/41702_1 /TAXON_ID=39447 /ORGANISM="" /LENGTH=45 /DNA_ID= /DNA_START= /DNA_END= /DNA_ORIENTATION=
MIADVCARLRKLHRRAAAHTIAAKVQLPRRLRGAANLHDAINESL